jgi:hypothetical protein
MIEVEIQIPPAIQSNAVVRNVEQVCLDNDLTLMLKGKLAKYPGCVHWHFKKHKQAGTLEITWWENEHRLWFKIAEHRKGTWIEEDLPALKKKIERAFHKT